MCVGSVVNALQVVITVVLLKNQLLALISGDVGAKHELVPNRVGPQTQILLLIDGTSKVVYLADPVAIYPVH